MKAIRLHDPSDPTSLIYEDAPEPQAGEGEVLVGVHAAAVTPTERAWVPTSTTRTGALRPFPIILGHEFSGEICAVGPGVTDLARGDAVFGMNDWFRDGAQAEYCVARATEVAAKPRSLDHVQAAATPISALTATVGGETLARSWSVLKPGGALVTVATSSEAALAPSVRQAFFIVEPNRTHLAELARLIDTGTLRSIVGAVFPLAEGRDAYERKPVRGKAVLRMLD